MRFKDTIAFISFFILTSSLLLGANDSIDPDSLYKHIKNQKKDSNAVNNLLYLSEYYSDKNLTKSHNFSQKAFSLGKELNYHNGQAQALYLLSTIEHKSGDLNKAIDHLKQSTKFYVVKNNKNNIARNNASIGNIYATKGDFVNSIEHYQVAITIYKKAKNDLGIATCYSDMGWVNFMLSNYKQALNYFIKSKKLLEKNTNQKELAKLYNRISNYYNHLNEFETSLKYDYNALMIQEGIRDKTGIIQSNFNIAKTSIQQNEFNRARGYIDYAIKISTEIEDKIGLIKSYLVKAELEIGEGNYDSAENILNLCVTESRKSNSLKELSLSYKHLARIKEKQQKYDQAYSYLFQYNNIKDSLNSNNNLRQFSEMQVKYATKNKEKELKIEKIKNEKQGDEIMFYISIFAIGFSIFILVLFFQFKRNQLRKESNNFLSKKNDIIGRKNQSILDSLMYAKRIQDTMLTPKSYIDKLFKDNFVLYTPKDIVSGDFYWAYRNSKTKNIYWVVADCTGHGVPGALMSMIGTVLLNEIVIADKVNDLSEILTLLSKNLKRYLNSGEEENLPKEGMALTICKINQETKELSFAGATNSVFLIRNKKLKEFKGDPVFIGNDPYGRKIQKHEVINHKLQEGDKLYSFTDGFPDQIGEETKKKYKVGALKNFLVEVSDESLEEQKKLLSISFSQHKGKHVQLDDILIMGITI